MSDKSIYPVQDVDALLDFVKCVMADRHIRTEQICADAMLHRSSVYRILNGQVRPSADAVFEILHAAGCSLYISKF